MDTATTKTLFNTLLANSSAIAKIDAQLIANKSALILVMKKLDVFPEGITAEEFMQQTYDNALGETETKIQEIRKTLSNLIPDE